MSVTVVVYGRDGAQHLADALRSIERQGSGVDVVAVDGGSNDRSLEMLRSSSLAPQVIELGRDVSLPKLASAGAAAATGDWVCFLGYDDALAPGVLTAVTEPAEDADVIVCDAIAQDGFKRSVQRAPLGLAGRTLSSVELIARSPQLSIVTHLGPTTTLLRTRLRPAGLLSFRAGPPAAAWRAWAWEVLCADVRVHHAPSVLTYVRTPAPDDARAALAGAVAGVAGAGRTRPAGRVAAQVLRAALEPVLAKPLGAGPAAELRRLLRAVSPDAVEAAGDALPAPRRAALARLVQEGQA